MGDPVQCRDLRRDPAGLDPLAKLSTLPLLAGRNIDADFIVPTIASSLDLVVHLERRPDGRRQVAQILAPTGGSTGRTIEAATIFERRGPLLEATGSRPTKTARLEAAGIDPARVVEGTA